MKKYLTISAAALILAASSASAQHSMEIRHNDSRTDIIALRNIQEISFVELQEGVDYVDLGLPSGTLWATRNVGAKDMYDAGDTFTWCMTTPFNPDGKISTTSTFAKMDPADAIDAGIYDEDCNVTAAYDAATVNMGTIYRIPTDDEWKELINNCSCQLIYHGDEDYPEVYNTTMFVTGPNGHVLRLVLPSTYRTYEISNGLYKHWYYAPNLNDNRNAKYHSATLSGYVEVGDKTGFEDSNTIRFCSGADYDANTIRPVLNIKKPVTE